ncbi:hypothetical protein RJ035_006883 [Blastomyces gilchristii]
MAVSLQKKNTELVSVFIKHLPPFMISHHGIQSAEEKLWLPWINSLKYMIDNFFHAASLVRASSVKTPQPKPTSLSSKQAAPIGTRNRVSKLRQECLSPDHHRCVASRKFDRAEVKKRLDTNGDSTDDDRKPLRDLNNDEFECLEVAHIIPHSLTFISPEDSQVSRNRQQIYHILKIFDPDAIHLIEGQDIDSPKNALTVTQKVSSAFQRI